MQIGIFKDPEVLADSAAKHVYRVLERNKYPALGVATGSTPLPLYRRLRAEHARGSFSLRGVRCYALDEYVGIEKDHPERYRNVLRAELIGDDKTGLREEDLFTPDGEAPDPYEAALEYDDLVIYGRVTLQLLGIGADGHIGFNEPGVSLSSRTHVDTLTHETRLANARFFDGDLSRVPKLCITQGLATIMKAKSIMLIATGEAKADAIKQLVEGGTSPRWPVTALQWHPDVYVLVDEAAASKLELKEFYRARWEAMREGETL